MRVLAYADNRSWAAQLASAADALGGDAAVFVPGRELADDAAKLYSEVFFSGLGPFEPVSYSAAFSEAARSFKPDLALLPCTNKGRSIAGLYSSAAGIRSATDVISLSARAGDSSITVRRLVYGGRAEAEFLMSAPAAVCVVQGSYPERGPRGGPGQVHEVPAPDPASSVDFKPKRREGVQPEEAEVVVVAGRGIRSKEDLELVKELARALGGAWSVTRPLAADQGWADSWVGISGLVVSPKLYIGVGVSGQPHHMMGARGSKIIVAINKDPGAPIFEECDYGIVGDLYAVVPELLKLLGGKDRGL